MPDQRPRNPEAGWSDYASPAEIADAADLTRERKLALLRAWEEDARALEVAADENMPGRESKLSRIRRALLRLGDAEPAGERPTKHGG